MTDSRMDKQGSFVAVSTGMLLAGHMTTRGKELIKNADVVFSLVSHPLADVWLKSYNENLVNLQHLYGEGKHRLDTYEEMIDLMMDEVRKGKNVCGAFYGHAGVFACVPHETINRAKSEGYFSYMEPGISSEACLYSDLLIDPGTVGVQSYESSQFLFYGHTPNVKSYLLLWQIAHAGDTTARTFEVDPEKVQLLVDHLLQWYPKDHKVILYEAAVLPIEKVRKDEVALGELSEQPLELYTTLVIPPSEPLTVNFELLEKLGLEEKELLAR